MPLATRALVMELVEGETLAARIAREDAAPDPPTASPVASTSLPSSA
jgi:hypothetical protein